MFKKKDNNPASDATGPADEFGDTGGPIGHIDPDALAADQDATEQELAALRSRVEELNTKYLTALADFQNFQRRSIENEREARRQGITSVVGALLGVLDIFDLALKQDPRTASADSILQGVSMIRQQMTSALATVGVTGIDPRPGEDFDPHRHEAVAHLATQEVAPGKTFQTFQPGYALGDRVLRPAKVAVAKAPDA
jgi:molecular chaperone GrpE